jgi:hypothetical protein
MDLVALTLAALAVYRLARMISSEEGPGAIFTKLRGRFDPDQQTWIGRGLNCQLCVGFWLALPIAFLVAPLDPSLLLAWWGIAGAAALIAKWEQKR